MKFNPLWLEDIYETVLVDYTVDEIHPLILNPGRLLLSTERIYFQPYNNIQPVRLDQIEPKTHGAIHSFIRSLIIMRDNFNLAFLVSGDKD